jgi:hypothetical protein
VIYISYSFSTSALDGGEWSASLLGRALAPGVRTPGTHWAGVWVGPRAGLDTEARGKILSPLPGIEPRSPDRPARSQTLYCLSYTDHLTAVTVMQNLAPRECINKHAQNSVYTGLSEENISPVAMIN